MSPLSFAFRSGYRTKAIEVLAADWLTTKKSEIREQIPKKELKVWRGGEEEGKRKHGLLGDLSRRPQELSKNCLL